MEDSIREKHTYRAGAAARLFRIKRVMQSSVWGMLAFPILSSAATMDASGHVSLEAQYFLEPGLTDDEHRTYTAATALIDFYYDSDRDNHYLAGSLYVRAGAPDDERTHFDARELYYWRGFDYFETYIGIREIFWGVTESVHLVDIINQTDVLEGFDGNAKLGQPALEVRTAQGWGTVAFFVLPYFREQEFPAGESRLRPRFPIFEDAQYQAEERRQHVDYALRWSHYVDLWDIGLSHFRGTSRDPLFIPAVSLAGDVALRPAYQQIEQTGLDLQATVDAWLLKLEVISRYERRHGRNTALVGGFEYTFFGAGGTRSDLGVIAEYQFDDRRGLRERVTQNDLVLGGRWSLNDPESSQLLFMACHDLDYGSNYLSLEGSRRLTGQWKLGVEMRFFEHSKQSPIEYVLHPDNYIEMEVQRYF